MKPTHASAGTLNHAMSLGHTAGRALPSESRPACTGGTEAAATLQRAAGDRLAEACLHFRLKPVLRRNAVCAPLNPEPRTLNTPLPPECLIWIGLLVLCNLPFGGVSPVARWTFLPDYVLAGEWWRAITFPFVHVSGYHLWLDAGAFLGLYAMWEERSAWRRVVLVGASCAGGLAGAACVADFARLGLCGLSGPAHGLAALVAIESIRAPRSGRLGRLAGWAVLLAVVAKSVAEAVSGQVIFGGLHPGSVGVPNPVCHAGGVAGALLAWGLAAGRASLVRERAARTA